ncbi:MAG: elongation factor P [Parcubacteria group bacterium]|nr:elongation factor P [Parcubacteria group bacterium]
MLNYNDLTPGVFFIMDGQPYEVLSAQTAKKNRQKATNQAKIRNLISGKTVEKTFHQSDSFEPASIEKKTIVYIYHDTRKGEFWFHEEDAPSVRFTLPADVVANQLTFVKEKSEIDALVFGEDESTQIIGITPPIKVELEVVEAAPAVRGNTAQNATKDVVVETGARVTVPLFINQGDHIRINTQTGNYTERA